jgi:hypothetical protein
MISLFPVSREAGAFPKPYQGLPMATKKPKPKIGRPPTARGAYNPNPCRQLGRVGDEDWQEIRQGARDADQNYTQWAVKCLLREARLATGTRLKDAQDAASKAAKTQAKTQAKKL